MKIFGALLLSLFVSASSFADQSYVGIGVITEKKDKFREVTGLVENGPAHKAGVKLDDLIVAVDSVSTKGVSSEDFSNMIRGKAGTPVVLSITNKKNATPFDITVIRDVIVLSCYMEGNVNLNFVGDIYSGYIYGYIGQDPISLNVLNGQASGSFKNGYIYLSVNANTFGSVSVSGYVNNGYINWTGFGSSISTYQPCIY